MPPRCATWRRAGRSRAPISGLNGEARAQHPDYRFRDGDGQCMGDPPHEPQGWYGIFTGDTTVRVVADHAAAIARLPQDPISAGEAAMLRRFARPLAAALLLQMAVPPRRRRCWT
jgi:hypothetical protein